MKMLVAVNVVERQAGRVEFFKLGVDFPAEGFPQITPEKVAPARRRWIVLKIPRQIHQPGFFFGWQDQRAAGKREMQADTEPGMFPGQFNRFVKSPPPNHEAGSGQDAAGVRLNHRLVDGTGPAEIIRIDDEPSRRFRACHRRVP